MHENRHFLSYRKRHRDAENHVHIYALRHFGESLQNGQQPQGNRLGKNPVRISKDEAPTLLSVVGPLFISFLLFHLSPTLLGAWRFSLFRSVYPFTTGQTSSGSLPFIGCFILFSQFILVCFTTCKNENVLFVLVQQTSDFVASLLGFGVGLVASTCHSLFFLLACPFVSRVISFIYDVRVRGVVSMFNETSHSFFVWGNS